MQAANEGVWEYEIGLMAYHHSHTVHTRPAGCMCGLHSNQHVVTNSHIALPIKLASARTCWLLDVRYDVSFNSLSSNVSSHPVPTSLCCPRVTFLLPHTACYFLAAGQVQEFMRNMGLGMIADQLADLKLGELLDTPPPGLDEAVAIAKVCDTCGSVTCPALLGATCCSAMGAHTGLGVLVCWEAVTLFVLLICVPVCAMHFAAQAVGRHQSLTDH